MKSLGDAIRVRNHLIEGLEAADFECAAGQRDSLLTVVVAGGGFSGVETIAGINDFLRGATRWYKHLSEKQIRVVLVHPGPVILPELGERLALTRKRNWPNAASRSTSTHAWPRCTMAMLNSTTEL